VPQHVPLDLERQLRVDLKEYFKLKFSVEVSGLSV
jgi:hypothetical protein